MLEVDESKIDILELIVIVPILLLNGNMALVYHFARFLLAFIAVQVDLRRLQMRVDQELHFPEGSNSEVFGLFGPKLNYYLNRIERELLTLPPCGCI